MTTSATRAATAPTQGMSGSVYFNAVVPKLRCDGWHTDYAATVGYGTASCPACHGAVYHVVWRSPRGILERIFTVCAECGRAHEHGD